MVIDKLNGNQSNGFEPEVLYCFNYHLKGSLCNQCKSKTDCKKEENVLKKHAKELRKISGKTNEIHMIENKYYSIKDMMKQIKVHF